VPLSIGADRLAKEDSIVEMKSHIREHMPVVCSNGGQFAVVDHVDGDAIKLTKKDSPDGQHHWIPLSWVTHVDDHVHVDRPAEQAMREWFNTAPQTVAV
jgi:hypothetical protein